jgi:hypothetical protein
MTWTGARPEDGATLIARIAQGDREAFSRFHDVLAGPAFRMIRRVLRDPRASREVPQELFWLGLERLRRVLEGRQQPVT